MNEEKRKIGEYTVLCSVNVGEKEVILASNEQSTNGDKYMCGFAERNDLFELCSECMVSDDYIEIVHLFGSRVANEAELFKEQVEKLDIPITLITEADCIPDHYSKDINGKIIAIDPKVLKPEFQRADRQLYYVTGGFGASASSRGSAVFCTNCALPGFVDSKNEEKTERNAGYLVVSHSGGGMLRQGTRKGIRRTPANRGMRAHWVVKGLDISEDVCHGMCP